MTTDIDMAAVTAAAAAALAEPADPAPTPAVHEAHQCQTGCGRLANVVVVRLADSDLDILCDVCHMMLMLEVAAAVPIPAGVDGQAEVAETEASTDQPPQT